MAAQAYAAQAILFHLCAFSSPTTLYSPRRSSGASSKIYQWLGPIGLARKIYLDISPTPLLIFTGEGFKSATFGLAFSVLAVIFIVAFEALWFRNRASCRQSNTCRQSAGDLSKYYLRNFAHPSPNFLKKVSKSAKFVS